MKRFYFTILCVVLSLSGCVNGDEGIDTPSKGGLTTLKATAELLELKLGNEVQSSSNAHIWNTDMALGAFGSEGGENAKYSLFSDYNEKAEGLFFGAEVKGAVYAYYPYNKDVSAEGSKVALTLPDKQIYSADCLVQYEQLGKILVAKSLDENISLGYLYGMLAIEVVGDFTVNSIKLTSDTEPLAGRVAIDFENNMECSAIARSLYELTLDCGEGVATTTENPTKFYVMLPPATYTTLAIEIETNNGVLSKNLMGSYTVERVTSTAMAENMSSGTIVADFAALSLAGNSAEPRRWSEGAQIGVFSENSNNTKYSIATAGVGQASASFVGMVSTGAVTAYYPYSNSVKHNEGKLLLVAGDLQRYNADLLKQFDASTPFMIGSAEEGAQLSLKYVMGVLGMRVSANMNVKYIEVTSTSKPIAGRLWVDTANGFVCEADEVGSKSTITIDASNDNPATSLESPTTFYAMLPAGEYEDLQVTITSNEGDILSMNIDEKVVIKSMDIATIAKDITYQTIDITLEEVDNVKKAWKEGDLVAVYSPDRGRGITSKMLNTVGSANNQVIAVGTPEEDYNLFYPAGILTSQLSEKAVFDFPAQQIYSEGSVAEAAQIYAGVSRDGKAKLYHINSILAVDIVASYADCEISSVLLSSKDNPLAGTMNLIFDSTERPVATFTESSKNIQIIFEQPISLAMGEGKTFYISIPAATYAKEDLTVSVGGTLGATVETMAMVLNAEAAVATELSLTTIKATNLSAGEKYANTFVLPNRKGWYMFDAKIRGGHDKDADDNEVISATSIAGCIFEKNSGMITKVAVCNNAKSVSFYYDGSKGNASVATINDGAVQWAWFLWCPAEEQPEDVVMGSNTYMDRNLGSYNIPKTKAEVEALTDEKTMYEGGGMLFQWGRPSPFPTVVKNVKEEWAARMGLSANEISQKYYHPAGELITQPSYGGMGTVAKKVHQYFYCENNVYWSTPAAATKDPLLLGCYLNNADSRFWDANTKMNPKSLAASWNYSNAENKQYDPCPYGYEVPVAATMVADLKAFYADREYGVHLANQDQKVFKGGYYTMIGEKLLWWPVTGGRSFYGIWQNYGSPNCTLGSATTTSSNHTRIYCGNGTSAGSSGDNNNWAPSSAFSIRCVKKQ